jgi:hypothetical protein
MRVYSLSLNYQRCYTNNTKLHLAFHKETNYCTSSPKHFNPTFFSILSSIDGISVLFKRDRLCGLAVSVRFLALQDFLRSSGSERGPLSLVRTTDELLGKIISGSRLEIREYGCRDPSLWSRGTLYPQKLALTSPISGGRSVGIVRSRTDPDHWFLFSKFFIDFFEICVQDEPWTLSIVWAT